MKKNLIVFLIVLVLFSAGARGAEQTGTSIFISCNGYGVSCNVSGDCCSGLCSDLTCACAEDDDCPDGVCLNSTCVECVVDDDCPAGRTCLDNVCIYCGDGTCNGDESCSSCSEDCGSCPDAPPSDTGAGIRRIGGAVIPTIKAGFEVTPDTIKLFARQGETYKEYINIKNTGNRKLDIEVELKNLKEFVIFPNGLSRYEFSLKAGDEQTVQVIFNVAKDQKPGVYPGKFVASAAGVEKAITVVVEVEPEEPMFDVSIHVEPRYKTVFPGDLVYDRIWVYNMRPMGRFDANLEYGIKDFDGNILVKQTEIFAMETHAAFVRSLLVPGNTEPGKYIFYAQITYNGTTGVSSDEFNVVKKDGMRIFGFMLSPGFLIGLAVVSVLIIFGLFLVHSLGRMVSPALGQRALEERLAKIDAETGVMGRVFRARHRHARSTTDELERELRSLEEGFKKK